MAIYVITDDASTDWSDDHRYKYRRTSSDGSPVAQDEIDRRVAVGEAYVLWRWENHTSALVESHGISPEPLPKNPIPVDQEQPPPSSPDFIRE